MNRRTQKEVQAALTKVPRPIADFVSSELIGNLIRGIRTKHKLNIMETGTISDIIAFTLVGLESESALETNLHQEMPELSSQVHRELATDINDRIFKEAQRRLHENIVEPEQWDEEELGPKSDYTPAISDRELEKRVTEEEKRGGFKPPAPPPSAPARVPQPAAAPSTPALLPTDAGVANASSVSILTEKLGMPTVVKNEINEMQRPLQKIAPPPPRLKGDADPYREKPE
jgi:hypothetical protein